MAQDSCSSGLGGTLGAIIRAVVHDNYGRDLALNSFDQRADRCRFIQTRNYRRAVGDPVDVLSGIDAVANHG